MKYMSDILLPVRVWDQAYSYHDLLCVIYGYVLSANQFLFCDIDNIYTLSPSWNRKYDLVVIGHG